MRPEEIASIERATLAAVSPAEVIDLGDWLVALDPGTIRRAASAVPLSHSLEADPDVLDQIDGAFASRGLRTAFRLPDVPGLAGVAELLTSRGLVSAQPTLVKVCLLSDVAALAEPAEALAAPDEAWGKVFLSEGFDPVDGANRVAALSRSADALYGRVKVGHQTVAVGVGAYGEDWVSFHGMRTEKSQRGQGHAGRILSTLARAGLERGMTRGFLQVEEANSGARSLYRRAGFRRAYTYRYWSRPA
jgi:GNAT superfamily N-acetyltransferase